MTSPGAPSDPYIEVLVSLARLEGKLEAGFAHQAAVTAEQGRRQDEFAAELRKDIQPRLRAVESRPTVSPKALLAGLGGMAGLIAAITPFLDKLYS